MASTTEVLSRLQASLSVYDPTWDVSVGSATYKILEAVAQEIAYANNNSILQTYSYDINTKSNTELDAFCNLFGVYRMQGKRASGNVTFAVASGATATSILDIPLGTQVAVPIGTNYTSAIYFATTAPAIIGVGSSSQIVPVVATLPGNSGNIPAGAVSSLVTSLNGITQVTNTIAMTGGADPESDATFRSRWQATVFNNTTGTQAKYSLTASQNPNVTSSIAVSQQQFYDEQLQINAIVSGSGSGASGVTFQLIAYSGMVSVVSGTTFSGTTVVASSGFATTTSPATLATGLQTMISGIAPSYNIVVTATGAATISGGAYINLSTPSPYRLTVGSGSTLSQGGVTTSGVVTISGVSYREYIQSLNPDLGVSGTMSYNTTGYSGYLFPQGNELLGQNLNTYSQITYSPNTDYFYPTNPVAQLNITIANGSQTSGLFLGNTIELISEYNPASSRSITLASGNFVDIFINGTTSALVTEQTTFNPALVISGTATTGYLNTSYYTLASGAVASTVAATSGDVYIPFDMQPMINFPSQLSVSTSGVADTIYIYNNVTNSGTNYPIALNPYNNGTFITFTGTLPSGYATTDTNFVPVANANSFLYPGLALASGTVTSGKPYYISSVSTSGIYLNNNATGSGLFTAVTGTKIAMSGIALVYPIFDTTNNQNSVLQTTGLAVSLSPIPTGWTAFPSGLSWASYTHSYNSDVTDVESLVQQSRPLGTNTLVHQAVYVPLNINVRIVFNSGYSIATAESSIYNAINAFFAQYNYLGTVSFAGLTTQILSVVGVANAKVTGVNTMSIDGSTVLNTKTNDFILASNQLPLLNNIVYTVTGASNF